MNYNGGMEMKREESRARSGISKHGALMLLCWLVYTCSVIGKINQKQPTMGKITAAK